MSSLTRNIGSIDYGALQRIRDIFLEQEPLVPITTQITDSTHR